MKDLLTPAAAERIALMADLRGKVVLQASSCQALQDACAVARPKVLHAIRPPAEFLKLTPTPLPTLPNRSRYDRIVMAMPPTPEDHPNGVAYCADLEAMQRALCQWLTPGGMVVALIQKRPFSPERNPFPEGDTLGLWSAPITLLRDAYRDRPQLPAWLTIFDARPSRI
jgi:hypothetical protein